MFNFGEVNFDDEVLGVIRFDFDVLFDLLLDATDFRLDEADDARLLNLLLHLKQPNFVEVLFESLCEKVFGVVGEFVLDLEGHRQDIHV